MPLIIKTPLALIEHIAKQARVKRLEKNLSQKTLSEKSGVSLAVIKKFERLGKISLESLLKIALVLDALIEFENLFSPIMPEQLQSLDTLLASKERQRGRE